ncbi:thiol-disulfide oxidoreductase DCC family protein [Streptomyces sp. CA-253872]|uniref:thiol-disulfide oxidoreductase DCC family protein n=1 Tax=Streptomyces sp. CA-253872 TaxID=3240067 RepID=UPI003D8ED62E
MSGARGRGPGPARETAPDAASRAAGAGDAPADGAPVVGGGPVGGPARPGREGSPVRGLTVLYDADCPLCAYVRQWLGHRRQLVPLTFVPAGSAEAAARFPGLDQAATLAEITAVGDGGQVYRGPAAWIVCLWALREYRALAHRLSTPTGARLARAAVLRAAKWRGPGSRSEDWGGGVYRRADGWEYLPDRGWVHRGAGPDRGGGGEVA